MVKGRIPRTASLNCSSDCWLWRLKAPAMPWNRYTSMLTHDTIKSKS